MPVCRIVGRRTIAYCDKLSAMAVKTEKELSETQRNLWLKVVTAVELRNLGYAISLLQEILKQEPQFLTGRQLLRRTEKELSETQRNLWLKVVTAVELRNLGYAAQQRSRP